MSHTVTWHVEYRFFPELNLLSYSRSCSLRDTHEPEALDGRDCSGYLPKMPDSATHPHEMGRTSGEVQEVWSRGADETADRRPIARRHRTIHTARPDSNCPAGTGSATGQPLRLRSSLGRRSGALRIPAASRGAATDSTTATGL